MMLRYSFSLEEEAKSIEDAVQKALSDGIRTTDLLRGGEEGVTKVSCTEMGDAIAARI